MQSKDETFVFGWDIIQGKLVPFIMLEIASRQILTYTFWTMCPLRFFIITSNFDNCVESIKMGENRLPTLKKLIANLLRNPIWAG